MILFWCATPYHLILCLHMASTAFINEKKILVLYDHFPKSFIAASVCKKIFDDVIYIRDKGEGIWNRWRHHFFQYDSLKQVARLNIQCAIFYHMDAMAISGLVQDIIKHNPRCDFYYTEDGIGSYLNFKRYAFPIKTRFFLRFLGRKKYLEKVDKIYLTYPELADDNAYAQKYRIEGLSKRNSVLDNTIKEIFGACLIEDCEVLLLEQPFGQDNYQRRYIDSLQERLFTKILEIWNSKKFYIKLHPRSQKKMKIFECSVLNQDIPMEAIQFEGIDKMTIVSVSSTATFTPFFLRGSTPKIVLLYKMCKPEKCFEEMELFMERFIPVYNSAGGEVSVPTNEEELWKCMK